MSNQRKNTTFTPAVAVQAAEKERGVRGRLKAWIRDQTRYCDYGSRGVLPTTLARPHWCTNVYEIAPSSNLTRTPKKEGDAYANT